MQIIYNYEYKYTLGFLRQTIIHDNKLLIFLALIDGGNKKKVLSYLRLFGCMGYYNYLSEETCQVHGTVSISDWTGQTIAKEMKMPMESKKSLSTMLTVSFFRRSRIVTMEVLMGQYNIEILTCCM